MILRFPAVAVTLLLAAGCDGRQSGAETSDQAAAPVAAAPAVEAQHWLGRWTGPEGTWLEISLADGKYSVAIMNLDGARTFPAIAVANGLSFERDGVRDTIRATNGADTGMKWLADKTDCLTVKVGEGYCRD
jgi:hypothetical protein